jgi:hypothetical protein
VLWQLQDIQEEKDNPQAQVVNIEVDELYDWDAYQIDVLSANECIAAFDSASSLSSTSMNYGNSISTPSCGQRNWKSSIIWQDMNVNVK